MPTLEELRNARARQKARAPKNRRKSTFFEIKTGLNSFRILLHDDDLDTLGYTLVRHEGGRYSYGLKKGVFKWNCAHAMFGERCAICDMFEALRAQKDPRAKKMKLKTTHLYNVVRHTLSGTKKVEGQDEVGLIEVVPFVSDLIWDSIEDTKAETGEDVLDPETGSDIRIRKTGSGTDTRYKVSVVRKPSKDLTAMEAETVDPRRYTKCPSWNDTFEILDPELQDLAEELGIEPPRNADTVYGGLPDDDDAGYGDTDEDDAVCDAEEEEDDDEEVYVDDDIPFDGKSKKPVGSDDTEEEEDEEEEPEDDEPDPPKKEKPKPKPKPTKSVPRSNSVQGRLQQLKRKQQGE